VKKLEVRSCAHVPCGKTFEAWPSQPRRFCSQTCSWVSRSRVLNLKPKLCAACGGEFQPTSARQQWCAACSDGTKAGRSKLRRYGITSAEWEQLIGRHDGKCWICREREADTVDHDHESGRVRGALCRICNMVLHYVERDGWWDAARSYLEG